MKKHIIAAAVAAAVAVPAMAQQVTVYGRIDAGYNALDNKETGTTNIAGEQAMPATSKSKGIAYGTDQTSLWGVRGSEDLGGGLKANFVAESAINAATNGAFATMGAASATNSSGQTAAPPGTVGAAFGSRLLYVGLENSSGELRVGHQSSFARDMAVGFQADGATNVIGNVTSYVFGTRSNAVNAFFNVGPLRVGAGVTKWGTEANTGVNTENGSGAQFQAVYRDGGFSAGYAYMKSGNESGATKAEKTTNILGASLDLGSVVLAGTYFKYEVDQQGAGTAGSMSAYNAGFRIPMGNATFFATYSGGQNTEANVFEGDVTGYNVGVRYALSKRTTAFAITGNLEIEDTAALGAVIKQTGIGVTYVF